MAGRSVDKRLVAYRFPFIPSRMVGKRGECSSTVTGSVVDTHDEQPVPRGQATRATRAGMLPEAEPDPGLLVGGL